MYREYRVHRRLPLRPPFLLVLSDGMGVTSSVRATERERGKGRKGIGEIGEQERERERGEQEREGEVSRRGRDR